MSGNSAFSASDLTAGYDKHVALWDLTFSIPCGRLVGIAGPNGAGKSTLLKAALGIVKPLSGHIQFFEKPASEMLQRVAYVPQRGSIDWDFPITVFEVVLMGRYNKMGMFRFTRSADKKAVSDALEKVGLAPYASRHISELSGGQQQRLFLARALVQDADLYLMDEPFQGLDLATEKLWIQILKKLVVKEKTILVVHHDLHTLREYFDSLILLNNRLVAYGKTEEVLTEKNLLLTFGKQDTLYEEVKKLSLKQYEGLR